VCKKNVHDPPVDHLCFPEGHTLTCSSQHSLCEYELNIEFLNKLNKSSDAEMLNILIDQGCFALDAYELIENWQKAEKC
jgi:hypothetical protein